MSKAGMLLDARHHPLSQATTPKAGFYDDVRYPREHCEIAYDAAEPNLGATV
jgi:hypothetical protein